MRYIILWSVVLLGASAMAAIAQAHSQHADHVAPIPDNHEMELKVTAASPTLYPSPPSPNFGPERGSITFVDTDPGETIGGTLTMRVAVDTNGHPVDAATNGITMYMVHWGLEVGKPGTQDDAGAGDLGGDCKGFRDTGHIVMKPAAEAGEVMSWSIPQGTIVPEGAVYFVGHTIYGQIHNLAKCTQTPINNWVKR
jgi:hypothetical protein